jgi:dihydroorotase
MTTLSILGGHLIDPGQGIDGMADVHIQAGRIHAIGPAPRDFMAERHIDATGLLVLPGLVDLSFHLGGGNLAQSLETEGQAALAGGITSACLGPDQGTTLDRPEAVDQLLAETRRHSALRVYPIGALTKELAGEQLTEAAALQEAGCIALGQGRHPLPHCARLRAALEYAASFDLPVFLHPKEATLSQDTVAHEGAMAIRLGLPCSPAAAESIAVAQIAELTRLTNARVHLSVLSAARSLDVLGFLSDSDLALTADCAIHQLYLTQDGLEGFAVDHRLDPPARTVADRTALQEAIATGRLQALCSDHRPIAQQYKQAPFAQALPGITTAELLLPLAWMLAQQLAMPFGQLLSMLTTYPARIARLPHGHLGIGAQADLCLFDPSCTWVVQPEALRSKSHCTPFLGSTLQGKVVATFVAGMQVHGCQHSRPED